jgi:hypothetical protein
MICSTLFDRLMPETHRSIGVRLPIDLFRQIEARVGIDGRRLTDVVLALLEKGLTSSNSVEADVEQRLAIVEQRLTALESNKTKQAPPPPANPYPTPPAAPAPRTAPEGGSYSAVPPGGHPRADGGRWLTTGDAARVAAERGGPGNHGTLKRWGAREPEKLAAIGLRYCPHGTKNNALASFEDLRYHPPG